MPDQAAVAKDFLTPLVGKARTKAAPIYDVESKDGLSQRAGFSRAFQVGLLDADQAYTSFRNAERVDRTYVSPSDFDERAIAEGGCIDRLMRELVGYPMDPTRGEGRLDLRAGRADLFGHNAGRFDATFVVTWLRDHRAEFEFSLSCVQGRIHSLTVWWRKEGKKKAKKHRWRFVDSFLILPMSLRQAGQTFAPDGAQKMAEGTVFDGAYCTCRDDPAIEPNRRDKHPKPSTALIRNPDGEAIEHPNPHCHGWWTLDAHETHPGWELYNEHDCRTAQDAIVALRDLVEGLGGNLGLTAPATAMNTFRRAFQRRWIHRNAHFDGCRGVCADGPDCPRRRVDQCDGSCHGCFHQWIRRGYVGGRTEIFHHFAPDGLFYYDINSSYSTSMLERMPIGAKIEIPPDQFLASVDRYGRTHVGFVEATVHVPLDCPIPPLPHLCKDDCPDDHPKDGKLRFYVGTFRGTFLWEELTALFDPHVNGSIVEVHRGCWIESQPVFDEFVQSLFKIALAEKKKAKKEGRATTAMAELSKLLRNSLYGKFGMNPEREEIVLRGVGEPAPVGGVPIDADADDPVIFRVPRYIDAPYIIPQISACITGKARLRLFRAMVRVLDTCACGGVREWSEPEQRWIHHCTPTCTGFVGGTVYYCDTDSIVCDRPLPPDLVGDDLGQWKREYDADGVLLSGEFVSPKFYMLLPAGLRILRSAWQQKTRPVLPCPVCGHDRLDPPGCGKKSCDGDCSRCKQKKQCEPHHPIVHMKGVGRRAQSLATFDRLRRGDTVRFTRVGQLKGVLRAGKAAPRAVEVTKRTRTRYDKRWSLPDGSTRPLVLGTPAAHA